MEPVASKMESGCWKMEPGVTEGVRAKTRVHEDNSPCGGGSQGSVGQIYPLQAVSCPERAGVDRSSLLCTQLFCTSPCQLHLASNFTFLYLAFLHCTLPIASCASECHLFTQFPSCKSPFLEFSSTCMPPKVTFLEISSHSLLFRPNVSGQLHLCTVYLQHRCISFSFLYPS